MSQTATSDNNVGDITVNFNPSHKRSDFVNASELRGNIFPGEVISKAKPHDNFQFVWAEYPGTDYADRWLDDLKDSGYLPVVESEWTVNRFEWNTPPSQMLRFNEERHLTQGRSFLWYRHSDVYRKEQQARQEREEGRINALVNSSIAEGQQLGMAVEGTYAGQPFSLSAPKRRTTVS